MLFCRPRAMSCRTYQQPRLTTVLVLEFDLVTPLAGERTVSCHHVVERGIHAKRRELTAVRELIETFALRATLVINFATTSPQS